MPAKLTQDQFIEKASKKHNNYYNYSLVNYINATTKVSIICPKHGEFQQQPNNHLFGQRCVWCMGDNVRNARSIQCDDFIKTFKQKHEDLYESISFKSPYIDYKTKILIETKYGDVLIAPCRLIKGIKPNISHAVCPITYLTNFIKINNPSLSDKIIKFDQYMGYMSPVLIHTIYGLIKKTPDSLIQGGGIDIRSAINKNEYLYNYLKIHQPQYINKNIQFLTPFEGNKYPITITLNNKKYITTPDALQSGCFSDETSKGRYSYTIIERNKLEFKNTDCILYKIRLYNDDESFYKIGITIKDIQIRLRSFPYSVEIISLEYHNLYDAYIREQDLHNSLINFKYKPVIKFAGQTECFSKINLYE